MKLNPNAVVPTLIHDRRVIIESTVIMHHVDDMFGGRSLTLAEPLARFRTKCEPGDESRSE
jgi:glutathione S-transferase